MIAGNIPQPYECWGCSKVWYSTTLGPPPELQAWRQGQSGQYCEKCRKEISKYYFTYQVIAGKASLIQIATHKSCASCYDWMEGVETKEVNCHPYLVKVSGLDLVTPLD